MLVFHSSNKENEVGPPVVALNIGAFIIRIGFGGAYYTIVIITNPQTPIPPILLIKAEALALACLRSFNEGNMGACLLPPVLLRVLYYASITTYHTALF